MAVFIDGCFWHGCAKHFVPPKANADYWRLKIARNRERDADTSAILESDGWTVLRFWEHEDPRKVAVIIAGVVRRAQGDGARPAAPTAGD
ncbi:DUF559 domain-containing protein [Agrococcus carbonis]|uniref:DUF559 domain-containing protein n=1 Tax=Agrococcus carbonis TaxID=684552 RepID=UPI000AD1560F